MPGINQLLSAIKSKNIGKLSKLLEKMDLNDINAKKNRETALHLACRLNFNEAVYLLVAKNGIDVNIKNSRGETPLFVAVVNNNVHAVTKILTNTEVNANIQDNLGQTPLHVACGCNHQQIVSALLAIPGIDVNIADEYGITPAMWAAGYCQEEALKAMLQDTRVDLDAKDRDGGGLEQQVGCGREDSKRQEKCYEIIYNERKKRGKEKEHQIEDGYVGQGILKINVQDKRGQTALHRVCSKKYPEILSVLLAIPGVDVNIADENGMTPIMWSARHCQEEALKLLLEDARVDLDAKDKDGHGLEVQVGCGQGDSIGKEKCLEMITNERSKRENSNLEKGQQSQDGDDGQRTEKVEKLNKQMEDLENRLKGNLDIENTEGTGDDEGNRNLVTGNEELMKGNVNKKGSVMTDNEELLEGNGEEMKKEGSLATVNEAKEENNNDIEMDYSALCWCCSKEDCKLYKCGGCRRARYCSDECIKKDWDVHGNYCLKQQRQRRKIKEDVE